jgi:hypothetical protein
METESELHPPVRWEARQIIVALFVVVFCAVQIAVPSARLFGDRGQRFGWQMFATSGPNVTVVGMPRGGALDTIDIEPYFAFRRSDLNPLYLRRLPRHICRVSPAFKWVAVRNEADSMIAMATCN